MVAVERTSAPKNDLVSPSTTVPEGAGASLMVIMPLLSATVSLENSARLPAQEWVINCQRLESKELKSSRNNRVNLLPEELLDELDELLEELDEELDELLEEELELLDEELVELLEVELEELLEDELDELLLDVLPPQDTRDVISSVCAAASKIWIKWGLRIFGPCIFICLGICLAPGRNNWRAPEFGGAKMPCK